MTIALANLPPPHNIAIADESFVPQSTFGLMPFHSRPDPQLSPRRISVAWLRVPASVADAIVAHADSYLNDTFTVRLHDTAQTVRVQWATFPTVQWDSEVTADVTGELVEALAYD